MKLHRIALALACLSLLAGCEKETTSHNASDIPGKAREILSQNFKSGVSLVETETSGLGSKEYEVTLTDGSEITFNHSGDWESIDTPNDGAVPAGLVPTAIANYINAKHKGVSIVGISKEKHGFDVELSNGLEIQFDKEGNFIKFD